MGGVVGRGMALGCGGVLVPMGVGHRGRGVGWAGGLGGGRGARGYR